MSLTLTGFKLPPLPLTGKSKKSRGEDTQIYFWLKLKSEKLILEIDQFSVPHSPITINSSSILPPFFNKFFYNLNIIVRGRSLPAHYQGVSQIILNLFARCMNYNKFWKISLNPLTPVSDQDRIST